MHIFKILGDKTRMAIITEMVKKSSAGQEVKSNMLLNKEVLGGDFDPVKHGKKAQAQLRKIVAAEVFHASKKKRGYYIFNPIKIHEAIRELQNLI